MSAVRIRQVTCCKHEFRACFHDKRMDDIYVLIADRTLTNFAGPIERKVEEPRGGWWDAQ
jgi:hypothetical protein